VNVPLNFYNWIKQKNSFIMKFGFSLTQFPANQTSRQNYSLLLQTLYIVEVINAIKNRKNISG